jgi:hypothetical protein
MLTDKLISAIHSSMERKFRKKAGDDIELHIFSAIQTNTPEPASFAAYIINHGVRLDLEELAI